MRWRQKILWRLSAGLRILVTINYIFRELVAGLYKTITGDYTILD